MHEEGLVHGDLHSANVIVTATGARIIDPFYVRSQAAEVAAQRAEMRLQDVRDFATIAKELLRFVPDFEAEKLSDLVDLAKAEDIRDPEAIVQVFASLAPRQAEANRTVLDSFAQTQAPIPANVDIVHLVVLQLDAWGLAHVTQIVANGHVTAAMSGVVLATPADLFQLRRTSRPIQLLRYEHHPLSQEENEQPKDLTYRSAHVEYASLQSIGRESRISLSTRVPSHNERLPLFELSRSVAIRGLLGPYLFVEESEWVDGGGAHPNVTCSASVLDLRTGSPVRDFLSNDETAALKAREGQVARVTFATLRNEELCDSEDIQIELAAIRPTLHGEGHPHVGLRALFTTFTAYAASDHRWSSYEVCEEVSMRRLPTRIAGLAKIPADLDRALRTMPPSVIGWSTLERSHGHFGRLDEIVGGRGWHDVVDGGA